jgi:hypothetical protein
MSKHQVEVQEQLNQPSQYFEADFIDFETYEENESPDAVHYANLTELRRLRQEMRTLLTLSDALGAVLTNAEKAQTYLAPQRARVSSRRRSVNEFIEAQG